MFHEFARYHVNVLKRLPYSSVFSNVSYRGLDRNNESDVLVKRKKGSRAFRAILLVLVCSDSRAELSLLADFS